MSDQDQLKRNAAQAALQHILSRLEDQAIIGVGTGSTVDFFIEGLGAHAHRLRGAVSSSERSSAGLRALGIDVLDCNAVAGLQWYVDGADEIEPGLAMIKGGGGALTREKIVAALAQQFVCIVDESKLVDRLGAFALPIEVIPMARNHVARCLQAMGGAPRWREGFVTDNGGHILDVGGLQVDGVQAAQLEARINDIAGVISCGFFARRPADLALVAGAGGVRTLKRDGVRPDARSHEDEA
ncbi:MAG: ribose-5-phosphate isomerase RpiA [Castellaniella sp.]